MMLLISCLSVLHAPPSTSQSHPAFKATPPQLQLELNQGVAEAIGAALPTTTTTFPGPTTPPSLSGGGERPPASPTTSTSYHLLLWLPAARGDPTMPVGPPSTNNTISCPLSCSSSNSCIYLPVLSPMFYSPPCLCGWLSKPATCFPPPSPSCVCCVSFFVFLCPPPPLNTAPHPM